MNESDRWTKSVALRWQALAEQCFKHSHSRYDYDATDVIMLDNCSACVLNGRGGGPDGPNYASWERLYVERQKPIPGRWAAAFLRRLAAPGDNETYWLALRKSVATFGVTINAERENWRSEPDS